FLRNSGRKTAHTFPGIALVICFDSDFSTVTFDEGTPFGHHAHALDHSRRRPDQAGEQWRGKR
ncbi:hypothetical protein, partial [Mesorhizobium sp.]|uniref:hypothetical protein n=1 Tax=Mesorhizobium sp. TaxID=1871066 RepID=UPI0025B8D7EE